MHLIRNPFPKRQVLDSSELKQVADDNFKFYKNGRQLSKTGRKHSGKMRNCSLRAISPFPTVFFKRFLLHTRKIQGLFGKGLKLFRGVYCCSVRLVQGQSTLNLNCIHAQLRSFG